MAFDNYYQLRSILETAFKNADYQSIAANFLLEERLQERQENHYAGYTVVSSADAIKAVDDWLNSHGNYVWTEVYVDEGETPATFRDDNRHNFIAGLEADQYLVRLENLQALHGRARFGEPVNVLLDKVGQFIDNPHDAAQRDVMEQFLYNCNLHSDRRPTFAGFWGEVEDLLNPHQPDWANRLRDRFGLGHLDPIGSGGEIPVALFRYRLSDVLAYYKDERYVTATPTVLDSELSSFFFPTPEHDDWPQGQTLDLTPGTENDYDFKCEVLHRYMPYQADHLYQIGWITASPGKTCEGARRIHLQYLEDDLQYAPMLRNLL